MWLICKRVWIIFFLIWSCFFVLFWVDLLNFFGVLILISIILIWWWMIRKLVLLLRFDNLFDDKMGWLVGSFCWSIFLMNLVIFICVRINIGWLVFFLNFFSMWKILSLVLLLLVFVFFMLLIGVVFEVWLVGVMYLNGKVEGYIIVLWFDEFIYLG